MAIKRPIDNFVKHYLNKLILFCGFYMSQITLSHNLQHLMRIHGNISVSELARLTNLPQPTIHHILSGATKNPRAKALEALSKFFLISINQLVGQEYLPTIIPETVKDNLQISTIPIIEWDMLNDWPVSEIKNGRQILMDKKIGKHSFALVMPDSSMEPTFQQQTLLIFDSAKIPKDRDFVIAYLNHENTIKFNRLFIENNVQYIKQNTEEGNFKLTKLDMNIDRIVGTLIEGRVLY